MLFSVIDRNTKRGYYVSMLDIKVRKWLEQRLPDMFQIRDLDSLTSGLLTYNNIRQILFRYPDLRPFPGSRLGRKVMVAREDLLEWLEKYNDRIICTTIEHTTFGRILHEVAGNEGEAGSAGKAAQGKGE